MSHTPMMHSVLGTRAWSRGMLWVLSLVLALVAMGVPSASAQSCPQAKTGKKYKVTVDSAPRGATVYVGGKECAAVGVTPWNGELVNGDYPVTLELEGYQSETRNIKVVRSRKPSQLFVPLIRKAEPPKVDVRADVDRNVAGAQVFFDGTPSGQAPTIVTTVPGRHLLELRKEGYEPYSYWVEVKENQTSSISPTLHPVAKAMQGSIVVEADVAGAEVWLDGKQHTDSTPTAITGVVEGVHVIEVRKAPAMPWKQTVQVTAGQQTKVRAELSGSMQVGTVRVISNISGAHAFIDGSDMGPTPLDIKDIRPGEHVVEVKAAGYQTKSERVTVAAGSSSVLKVDLSPVGAQGQGTLKIIAQVPDAEVYLDGASIGKAPQERVVDGGSHKVLVKLAGHKDFTQEVNITNGATVTIAAELKAVGRLRVLATPDGAAVTINGLAAGVTPLDTDVEVGPTVVRIASPGLATQERAIDIVGGKTETISVELVPAGKSDLEMQMEQRGLSSFGARTLPRGRSTVDMGVGYPYYLQGRINVGGGEIMGLGFDAGVSLRSMFARQELGLGGRAMLVNVDPFTAGVFTDVYWGSKLFDNSKRNGVTWDIGAAASLTAMSHVTITLRGYLNIWSDRHCPELNSDSARTLDGDGLSTCTDYASGAYDDRPEGKARIETLTGQSGDDFFSRDQGLRFLTSITAEIAVRQHWNFFAMLEGAPFQDERALFTHAFSRSMFASDFGLYFRTGLTYKF